MAQSSDVRRWLESGVQAVKRARGQLDAINVFPVADSDTGTNMYLTLREGNRAVAALPEDASHREVVAAFARGALLGARGNSGVIVSQYLSAFLTRIDHHGGLESAQSHQIADALAHAADAAYEAVSDPVEGTILSVARSAADGAMGAVDAGSDRASTIVAAVMEARASLARTHLDLPEAHAAGVVDAGAAGLVLQLEMLAETLAGPRCLDAVDDVEWEVTAARDDVVVVPHAHDDHVHHPGAGAYEVMFVIEADRDLGSYLRETLVRIGDSVAVSGTHGWWQAHVHTNTPHLAVKAGADLNARQLIVRNIAQSHVADRHATGVVALTQCPGLAGPLADAGAVVLVVPEPAGLTKRELRRAITDASGRHAIVVAGSPALRAAAQALSRRKKGPTLEVLPAVHEAHVVSAVAAATVATPGEDLGTVMREAIERTAVTQSTLDALDADLDAWVNSRTESVTLIVGQGVSPVATMTARTSVRALAPDADIVVIEGGQSSPPILVGVEGQR